MKTCLAIATLELRRILRERSSLFWIFVGPILFTSFFGVLFRPPAVRPTAVEIVNRDCTDQVARTIALLLEKDGLVPRPSESVSHERWAVEIPDGAAATLAEGSPLAITLHSVSSEETDGERRMRFRLEKALLTTYFSVNPGDVPADTTDEQIRDRLEANRAISVRRGDLGLVRREITSGFQRSVPAYLVMFVFMNLLIAGAGIAEERASGRLRRVFVAPVRKWEILGGHLLSRIALGWIQTAWILLFGLLVFRIRWAEHPWLFFGFLTLLTVASGAVGMLLGTVFRDPDKCRTVAVWTGVLLSPLGGLWWPLEVVGPTMRKIGHFVPTGWAMEAVNAMLAFGAGFSEVWTYAAALLTLAVASLIVAARRLSP